MSPLRADFSYQETTTITGGTMMAMMKFAGAFSKQAREPVRTTVAVKGDRMMHGSAASASIINLGNETITHIDFQKKTYSVMTFAEMKEAMEAAAEKMKQSGLSNAEFKVEVTPTGNTKQFQGLDAKETIIKLTMETTDAKSGQKGGIVITTNSWLAPAVPGYEEVRAFHRRMAEKMNFNPGGGGFMGIMNRPDVAKGMAGVSREMAKMDGVPVYQLLKMGALGMPEGAAGSAEQQAQPQQQQQQVEKPSAGSVAGGVLGGRLGRLGGLGRKKSTPKEEAPAQQEQAPPQQASQSAPRGGAPGALMEATVEASGFSSGPVDPSKFEVPAGFKKVEPEIKKMAK